MMKYYTNQKGLVTMKKILINTGILAILLVSCFVLYISMNRTNNDYLQANIYVSDELVLVIDLSTLVEETEFIIDLEEEQMVLLAGFNKIKVLEVCCPLEICKNTGYITLETQVIVCMPNEVFITLTKVST